jgi:hypothetical protein
MIQALQQPERFAVERDQPPTGQGLARFERQLKRSLAEDPRRPFQSDPVKTYGDGMQTYLEVGNEQVSYSQFRKK